VLSIVVELDAGHHPFLPRPAEVRDLIVGLTSSSTGNGRV
jgi:hypothetical protein